MTPFKGAFAETPFAEFYSAIKDEVRQQVNTWIHTASEFFAVIDLDELIRDRQDVLRLRAELDSGDHLHPNNDGYHVISQGIPINTITNLMRGNTS